MITTSKNESSGYPAPDILPVSIKISLLAMGNGIISRDPAIVHGILFRMLGNADPALSREFHEEGKRKPWSFSRIFFGARGTSRVRDGATGYFHVNTLDRRVHGMVMKSTLTNPMINAGKLRCEIRAVDTTPLQRPARGSSTVEMRFHSPTLFREHDDGSMTTWFDPVKLVRFQHDAMTRNGWMDGPPCTVDRLARSVVVQRNDTRSSRAWLHRDGKSIRIDGFSGRVVLRLDGNGEMKDWLARCLLLSQCVGIGSRTSMGFGHCSIKS